MSAPATRRLRPAGGRSGTQPFDQGPRNPTTTLGSVLSQSVLSPSRRWAALVALLASGAVVAVLLSRGDDPSAAAVPRGNVNSCVTLTGEAARNCYAREVGRELAAIGGAPQAELAELAGAQDTGTTVTFATLAAADTSAALLCDLHLRVGVRDESTPSWTSWVAQ